MKPSTMPSPAGYRRAPRRNRPSSLLTVHGLPATPMQCYRVTAFTPMTWVISLSQSKLVPSCYSSSTTFKAALATHPPQRPRANLRDKHDKLPANMGKLHRCMGAMRLSGLGGLNVLFAGHMQVLQRLVLLMSLRIYYYKVNKSSTYAGIAWGPCLWSPKAAKRSDIRQRYLSKAGLDLWPTVRPLASLL